MVVITLRVMHHAERDDYDDDGCDFQEFLAGDALDAKKG